MAVGHPTPWAYSGRGTVACRLLCVDLYPVRVTMPDGTVHERCKLLTVGGQTILAHKPRRGSPPVHLLEVPGEVSMSGKSATLETVGGTVKVDASRASKPCGCGGNTLATYRPRRRRSTTR